jgi:hypothetical protein
MWSQVWALWLLIWWPLETYMIVNFRIHWISWNAHKLARKPTLSLKKKKKVLSMRNYVFGIQTQLGLIFCTPFQSITFVRHVFFMFLEFNHNLVLFSVHLSNQSAWEIMFLMSFGNAFHIFKALALKCLLQGMFNCYHARWNQVLLHIYVKKTRI